MKTIMVLAFVLSLLALPALAGEAPQVVRSDLAGKVFVLKVVDSVPYTGEKAPTIEFGPNLEVTGAVCNRYRGAGVLDGSLFTVKQAISTRMACINEDLSKLETSYLAQLNEGVLLALHGNRLTMTGSKSVLVFELQGQGGKKSGPKVVASKTGPVSGGAAPATAMAANKYILKSVNGKAVDTGGKAYIEIADNNFVTGSLSSFFRGKGSLQGGVLTVADIAWAGMVGGNPDLNKAEAKLVELLKEGISASLVSGTLTLKGDGLELVFAADGAAPAAAKPAVTSAPAAASSLLGQLSGKKFVLKSVDGKDFKAENQPQIEFLADGRLTGRMCNGFMGSPEMRGDKLFLKGAVSTMMMCADGGLNKVEGGFHEMMQNGAAATFSGNELTLKGAAMTLVFAAK